MSITLPSFQIEVTEHVSLNGKEFILRVNANTCRICNLINPATNPTAQVSVERITKEPVALPYPKVFYSRIAAELSALSEQELLNNFSDIRICFSVTRSQKNYNFQFERV